ncbi:MAG: hypothetical protein NTX50_08165, partial [Candidatus Sumerlaeota bacterium]|nr:hypothetical protein [Candidatus Sumerlaeota bacterium]
AITISNSIKVKPYRVIGRAIGCLPMEDYPAFITNPRNYTLSERYGQVIFMPHESASQPPPNAFRIVQNRWQKQRLTASPWKDILHFNALESMP